MKRGITMIKDTITVKIKNVYGTDKVYPVCEQALRFANLTGTKTLTDWHIKTIKNMGFGIEVQSQTL